MKKAERVARVLEAVDTLFPDAECELIHHNAFELLIAVVLSAQTTDKSVNQVTPVLFQKYPTPEALANASLEELEQSLKRRTRTHHQLIFFGRYFCKATAPSCADCPLFDICTEPLRLKRRPIEV